MILSIWVTLWVSDSRGCFAAVRTLTARRVDGIADFPRAAGGKRRALTRIHAQMCVSVQLVWVCMYMRYVCVCKGVCVRSVCYVCPERTGRACAHTCMCVLCASRKDGEGVCAYVHVVLCVSRKDGEGLCAYMHVCVGGGRGWGIDGAWRGTCPAASQDEHEDLSETWKHPPPPSKQCEISDGSRLSIFCTEGNAILLEIVPSQCHGPAVTTRESAQALRAAVTRPRSQP